MASTCSLVPMTSARYDPAAKPRELGVRPGAEPRLVVCDVGQLEHQPIAGEPVPTGHAELFARDFSLDLEARARLRPQDPGQRVACADTQGRVDVPAQRAPHVIPRCRDPDRVLVDEGKLAHLTFSNSLRRRILRSKTR